MKKKVAMMSLALMLALTACNGDGDNGTTDDTTGDVTTETTVAP